MSYSLSCVSSVADFMWKVFRNPQAETENQEDTVVLEEVAPKTAMEVEDNPDPAGSEVLMADENIADNEDEGRIVQGGVGTKIFIFDEISESPQRSLPVFFISKKPLFPIKKNTPLKGVFAKIKGGIGLRRKISAFVSY